MRYAADTPSPTYFGSKRRAHAAQVTAAHHLIEPPAPPAPGISIAGAGQRHFGREPHAGEGRAGAPERNRAMLAMELPGSLPGSRATEGGARDRASRRRHRAVTRSCICGSDLHLYHGLVPDTRVGTTFGHEFIGVVEEVGPQVQQPARRATMVLVPFNIFCGSLLLLPAGALRQLPQHQSGSHRGRRHLRLLAHRRRLRRRPGRVRARAHGRRRPDDDPRRTWTLDDAVLLTDALPTGYQAAEMGDIEEGDTVVVFGAGPVGHLRRQVGLADGRRPRDRGRPRRLPAGVRRSAMPSARSSTSRTWATWRCTSRR